MWQNNLYAWLLLVTAIATSLMAVLALRRSKIPGSTSLFWLMVGVTTWSLGYALELSMTDLRWQVFWAKVEYLGILSVPLLWFILIIQFTRQTQWLTRRNVILTAVWPVVAFIFVCTNELHRLVWTQWTQKDTFVGMILSLMHGPLFYAIVAYSYLMLLGGAVLLVVAFSRSNTLYQRQSVIMLIGAAAPWMGNVLYITGFNPFPELDLTPFSFAITGMAVSWGLFRYRLLDIVPIARGLVVESMRDAVFVFDMNDQLLDLNASAQQIVDAARPRNGFEFLPVRTSLVGKPGREAIPFWPQIEGYLHDAGDHGDVILNNRVIPGTFEVFKTIIFDHQHNKAGQFLVMRDISRYRRIEAELRAAQLEADASSQAKSTFLMTMSHELHTPLTVMIGYAELLLENAEARSDTTSIAQLNKIRSAGEQLLTLITDVLDYTRLDSQQMTLTPELFDVRQMALEVIAGARSAIEANHNRLEVEIASVGNIRTDRTKAQQILASLLDNAAKFTQNGLVRLEVFREDDPGNPCIIFRVIDTGIGIEPERLKDLFKPFVQLDASPTRKYGGTGLGLALSYRLCKLLNSKISVESAPGKGSVFTFRLYGAVTHEQ